MITLTLFLFGFQVSATDKLQIVRFVTVAKQAECKLLLGHLYSKLHIQLGNFEPRISTVGAKRSLSVEVDRKEMVLRTVSSYKLELIKRQVSYCSRPFNLQPLFQKSGSRKVVGEIWLEKSGSRTVDDQKKRWVYTINPPWPNSLVRRPPWLHACSVKNTINPHFFWFQKSG